MNSVDYNSGADSFTSSSNGQLDFLSNPRVVENYAALMDTGVFSYIDYLNVEIRNYKNLFSIALNIFNRTSIDAILDFTVLQISDRFLPSFIGFVWRPYQNKEDVTIKGYQNYKTADLGLRIESITPFEVFFQQHAVPISYDALVAQMGDNVATQALREVSPALIIPIVGPSGFYGLILVGRKILGGDYNSIELTFIQQLMSFVSLAIQNNLHYEHSLRDVKTGLYNHGFFMIRLTEEIARVKRSPYTSSVIVIDVDFFKQFNDTYGHVAGDQVLENIAFMIKQGVRLEDVPSRFGGEEFTILLSNTDPEIVWAVAERLRVSIANLKVPWDVPLPSVTISLGIFTFDNNTNVTANEIVNRADMALYASKDRGRNCTTAWEPGLRFQNASYIT
ncbi:MAG: GGDEF domain-containing protein [Treponema sp.]|jgi:diguanylate cyclase (GGDEF)-like protein|nr:GGDEF domain-containing protein [Treponema sp.]